MEVRITPNNLADLLGTSRRTVQHWVEIGKYVPPYDTEGRAFFDVSALDDFPQVKAMAESKWDEESRVTPIRNYTSIELFAGAGGLALGMEQAGFTHVLLNEVDHDASQTLIWFGAVC